MSKGVSIEHIKIAVKGEKMSLFVSDQFGINMLLKSSTQEIEGRNYR